ncbi:MAG: TIGR02444 family protein [Phenylobacterium sp.]|uniref:TIGR02444 family protein n=1 Tax=Brevundimonas sp. TaxID=1871086 RepID=UPI0027377CE5|nr:TIGR02444 family protein [Brevundimonas sp.]MDP3801061.1 TIGR02444 family protein [Brevundimonas sp.]MDZ4376322.1 TIGR02444 family protein [Phenylobacterium sp.]
MSLRDWSLKAWAADGVADACLELQDSAGQNIPLLLWAAWCATEGRTPDEDALEAAADTARAWQETAIAPLRAVRRALKPRAPDLDDADREAVRAQVKAVELEAERRLLAALEVIAPPPTGPAQASLAALVAAARIWSPMTPRAGLVRLAERLPA